MIAVEEERNGRGKREWASQGRNVLKEETD